MPILDLFTKRFNVLPVKRGRGGPATLRMAVRLLRVGKPLLLFPEGAVSEKGKLQEPKAGVGMLVLKAKMPAVPVAILGSHKVLPKGSITPKPGRVKVKFGEQVDFSECEEDSFPKREAQHLVAEAIMGEISKLTEDKER